MTTLSFHGDPAIKEKFSEQMRLHVETDELVKGQYWQNGKGCAIACLSHDPNGGHRALAEAMDLPEWLLRLVDTLFEGLPNGHAKKFAMNFLGVIPVGVNLEPVKWKFCSYLMDEQLILVDKLEIDSTLKNQVMAAIRGSKKVHDDAIVSGIWDESAAWAAEAAAWAAEAAWAARAAAWAAEAAARAATYIKHADKLFQLLKEAK